MSKTTLTHPNHMANRLDKARRVLAFIGSRPDLFGFPDVDLLADFGMETWNLVNEVLDEPQPMSEGTITAIVAMAAGHADFEAAVVTGAEAIAMAAV